MPTALTKWVLSLCLLVLAGCSHLPPQRAFVTAGVVNVSTTPLDWVKVFSGERQLLSVGILIPNASSTSLDYVWWKMPDLATITFVDDQTRQRYNVEISLREANARVEAGTCKRVTIRILSYDRAEVVLQ
jgi:hypothetical protein